MERGKTKVVDADEIAVVKTSVQSVLRQRLSERRGCLSLPFTIAYFAFYTLMLSYHEDVRSVFLAESSMHNYLEDYSFDDAQSRTLHGIAEIKDVWMFLQDALVPAVFQQVDHLGHPLERSEWSRVLGKSKLCGGVLLEQYRMTEAEPPGKPELRSVNSSAWTATGNLSVTDILYFTGEGTANALSIPGDEQQRRLRGAGSSGGAAAVGAASAPAGVSEEDMYPFFLFEQESLEMIQKRLKYLEELRWLDTSTKQLAVKMMFVNEEIGIFQRVSIRFAFPASGGIFSAVSISSSFLKSYRSFIGVLIDIVWISLLLYIFATELKEVITSCRSNELKEYFGDVWNCLDWASIVMGWIIVLMFLNERATISKIESSVSTIKTDLRPDIAYLNSMYDLHGAADALATLSMWYRLLLADYMMLIMLRFFKAFKGQPRLAVVTDTIYHAASDLLHFFVVFMSIFLSFAFAGCILFGRRIAGFSSFISGFGTCFAILCGEFEWGKLSSEHPLSAMLWFWSFMVLVFLVMLNMVLAIVMDVYTRVRADAVKGDPIWVQAGEIASDFYQHSVHFANRMLKDTTQPEANKPVDVDDDAILKVLGGISTFRINASKLRSAIPHLSLDQAHRVLKDAESWQAMQADKGMSLSDAMKMIQKVNTKVDQLVLIMGEDKGGQEKNKQGATRGNVMLARKAVKRRVKRAIFVALFNGDLHKIAENLERTETQKRVKEIELERKIRSAEAMLNFERGTAGHDMRDGQRNPEDTRSHMNYSSQHGPSSYLLDSDNFATVDHLSKQTQGLNGTLSELSADLKNIGSLQKSLKEVSSCLKSSGSLEKTLSEVSSCLRGLRAALSTDSQSANPVPPSPRGGESTFYMERPMPSDISLTGVPLAVLPVDDSHPRRPISHPGPVSQGPRSAVSQQNRQRPVVSPQSDPLLPTPPMPGPSVRSGDVRSSGLSPMLSASASPQGSFENQADRRLGPQATDGNRQFRPPRHPHAVPDGGSGVAAPQTTQSRDAKSEAPEN